MEVATGIMLQPRFHLAMFVRGGVVHDQVQVQYGGRLGVDAPQEMQELLGDGGAADRCQ